jgi:hypothetical protein
MTRRKDQPPRRAPKIIGWREHVGLPGLGIASMPAKIDTGARTSALHAVDQQIVEIDGLAWVEFMIPVHNRRSRTRLRALLVEERDIRNTSGIAQTRLVIRSLLTMGQRSWLIDISLADREKMEFDLILGRTAIRKRSLLVDPGRSFFLGHPSPSLAAGPDGPSGHSVSPQEQRR